MGIERIFSSSFIKSVSGFVKKHPVGIAGGTAVLGLITYKAATTTKREANEQMNRFILVNPMLNPTGWATHIDPRNSKPNDLDGALIKYVIDKNNKDCQYYFA